MKKLAATLIAAAFGAALVFAPTSGIAVPGNSCNPPAGHGRSGCHRATTSAPSTRSQTPARKPRAKVKTVAKSITGQPASLSPTQAAADQHALDVQMMAQAASQAEAAQAAARAQVDVPAAPRPAEPANDSWWIALWRLIAP